MNYEDRVTKEYVEGLLAGGVKIATGSYVGTGTYGASNPCSMTFPFEPKLLFIQPQSNDVWYYALLLAARGTTCVRNTVDSASNSEYHTYLVWSGNTVSWYATNDSGQFNHSGKTYSYFAIG